MTEAQPRSFSSRGPLDNQVTVDGISTHYLEAGSGPTVVLLHSGEFGGCAELSWERVLDELSRDYRVVAPDLLGFGRTDKIYDFARKASRQLDHLSALLQAIEADDAYFMGNSMGATMALRAGAEPSSHALSIRGVTAISGGGLIADNEYRQDMVSFDGSRDGVVRMLQAMFHDPAWWSDDRYIERRHILCSQPGAWEAVAAARLRNPSLMRDGDAARVDTIEYERISVPVHMIAGAQDRLRESGYADEVGARIADCTVDVIDECGHCPNIECPETVLRLAVPHIERAFGRDGNVREASVLETR